MRHFRFLLLSLALATLAGCASINTPTTQATSTGLHIPSPSRSIRGISSPTDIWDRIRKGFAMPDLSNQLVRDKEAYYTQRPEYIDRMISRSNKYLYYIVQQLELRGMPTELALLPFVESAFNPQAVSSAKAAGMWQFIPSTGRQYALTQNTLRDERRDVVQSTRAALDYLQRLYNMFGDWQLALAAYNWGEGNVQRAIDRNQAAGLSTRYENLRMPNETREYVPKLQAIKNIVRNPATFNTNLPNVADHPYFETVAINRDMDVAIAARLANISVNDFKALNPAMNKPLIIASVTPHVLLPWESVATFERNLAAMDNVQVASWTVWRAPTTMSVSQAAQQTGATESQLRDINRIPPRANIKAGSTLLVPRPDGLSAEVPKHLANNEGPSFEPVAPEVVLRRSTIVARRGDTLAKISARYGLATSTVVKWNKVGLHQKLSAGNTVVLYLPQRQANRSKPQIANARQSNASKTSKGANKTLLKQNKRASDASPNKKHSAARQEKGNAASKKVSTSKQKVDTKNSKSQTPAKRKK